MCIDESRKVNLFRLPGKGVRVWLTSEFFLQGPSVASSLAGQPPLERQIQAT